MTNQAKHAQPAKGAVPTNGEAPNYGFLLESNQRAFARWLNGVNALSQEIAQFTQSRLQEDMAAWSALASCNSPEAAFECQRRFAQEATAGYVAEVAKLSQMMMSLASEGLEPRQRDADAVSSS
jgi:phasin family protein